MNLRDRVAIRLALAALRIATPQYRERLHRTIVNGLSAGEPNRKPGER